MSVFQKKTKSHLESKMFFDEGVDVARYDTLKYPQLDKLTDKQLGFFWRPEEIDVSKDKSDFTALTDFEKHIFTSNLKRQILLDSVQGRGPAETLMPVASIPEIEPLVMTWTFMETIHSPILTSFEISMQTHLLSLILCWIFQRLLSVLKTFQSIMMTSLIALSGMIY